MTSSSHYLAAQGFQIKDSLVFACNGRGFQNILQAGLHWLEAHLTVVNNLNVFPVPDGDTGTNMVLTMRAALNQIEQAADHQVGTIAAAVAQGALMGGRGNSGVILSQFLQGMAQTLQGQVTFSTADFSQAVKAGVRQAYQSMSEPVEGTILTVAQAAAEAAQGSVASGQDLTGLFTEMVAAARKAQAQTPELLPVLKEAGVTDSGGQGLLYILEGGLRFLTNQPLVAEPAQQAASPAQTVAQSDTDGYGYDVQFIIHGQQLDSSKIRAEVEQLGQSVLVVGVGQLVKVHVHVDDPGLPLSYGASLGMVSDVVVENMSRQAHIFWQQQGASASDSRGVGAVEGSGLVAVVSGQGLAAIFRSLGVEGVVPGGPTMNPSPEALLAVIDQLKREQILLLPNNRNVLPAARQVQQLTNRPVQVVATETIPQGIAAALAFSPEADLETNSRRMLAAARQVRTIEVTRAERPVALAGRMIARGDVIGLLDHQLASAGQSVRQVVLDSLAQAQAETYELVTLYYGQMVDPEQAQTLAAGLVDQYPQLEVELHEGAQPHYQYIISME